MAYKEIVTKAVVGKGKKTYKNNYVRNSGYRYVDLSKAVNTTGTNWYSGMLSSDNIHPTSLGAKTLCYQVLASVPEIQK